MLVFKANKKEGCAPLTSADATFVQSANNLLTHWTARLRSYIQRCHKYHEGAFSNALRLYRQATHTAHVHACRTSVGDMLVCHTA
jgi:hypothetical protein